MLRIAIVPIWLLLFMGICRPGKAQVPTYGWYPGVASQGASCVTAPGAISVWQAVCTSATADCQSIASVYGSPTWSLVPTGVPSTSGNTYNPGLGCLYTWFGLRLAGLYVSMPPGDVGDMNSFPGYVPSGAEQPPKLIGGGCNCSGAPSSNDDTQSDVQDDDPRGAKPTSNPSAGEPINIASGNMAYHSTDYRTYGPNPVGFSRYYNSRGTFAGTLGVNWRSSYDRVIAILSATTVNLQRADGQTFTFTLIGSAWKTDSDVDYTLTQSGSTWAVTTPNDTVETYTTNANGTEAILQSIERRGGFTETLTYNASNQLTSVVDSYGRSLTLSYSSNGLLASLTTPEGNVITYGFTSTPSGYNLSFATFPATPSQTVTYVYADTALPNALTSIVDESGHTSQTWTYDAYGRGLSSQGYNGLNNTTLAYDDSTGNRTVTNGLGLVETYTFATVANAPKLAGIDRAASLTTPAMHRIFTYDGNGYLASSTDWNGNLTEYVNNAHGSPTSIVEAAGTSVARTTAIAYDSIWIHRPHSITTQGLTTSFTYGSTGELVTRTLTDTTGITVPYSPAVKSRTWAYAWSDSELVSLKKPSGSATTFAFTAGALKQTTNALNQATNITARTAGGWPLTIVDPNGVTTNRTYSPRMQLLSSAVNTKAGALTTTYAWLANNELLYILLPDVSSIGLFRKFTPGSGCPSAEHRAG
jgi:YD repeat-containing protein